MVLSVCYSSVTYLRLVVKAAVPPFNGKLGLQSRYCLTLCLLVNCRSVSGIAQTNLNHDNEVYTRKQSHGELHHSIWSLPAVSQSFENSVPPLHWLFDVS